MLIIISSLVKPYIAPLEVNVNSMGEFLVVEPLVTVVDAIVMVGEVLLKVKVNVAASTLLFPASSVNLSFGTLIVYTPRICGFGVNVA